MVQKVWLNSYPAGMPAEIAATPFSSLSDLVEDAIRRFGDKPAFSSLGHNLSFPELGRLSNNFTAFLQSLANLDRGDRVAIMLPNLLQYPVVLFGILRAGLTVVNVNPLYTPRELEFQLKDSGAKAIVILENFAHTLQKVLPNTAIKHVISTQLGDLLPAPKRWLLNTVVKRVKKMVPRWRIDGALPLRRALARGAKSEADPVAIGHQDIAFLQYTGGTTGLSKGAMLTHRNILANTIQAHAWVQSAVSTDGELVVTALPLYHIFALTANCFLFLLVGANNLLITNPRDIPNFVAELEKYPFTIFTGVNTLFNALLNNPRFAALDFTRVKVTLGGGTAVQKGVAERWKTVTGKPLIEAYGLTETSPAATINPINIGEFNGSIGLPISSTEAAIRNDSGVDVPLGERGELCIRGPQVMKGYYNQPEETANVFMPDGFLRTGDIAVMDNKGYLRIVDRKKDMILVSGFNVYPNEVEDVLAMHPGVLEVAAIGVPDDRTGEAVKIFVVRKDPSLTPAQLIKHCREYLTAYKVPSQVEFRADLPKTNVGKIRRRELRDEAPR